MKKYNLIVAGGGMAGVAAAVTAAREGLSVLIVEKFGSFGGAMSNSLVYPYCRYYLKGGKTLLTDGIFTEIRKRKDEYEDSSWETYKFVFDDMVTEAGVDVLFHSTVIKADCEARTVKSVAVATKSGIIEFGADFFIDATGDGELIYMTGCECQLGRESDNLCQPMTTCFRLGNVDLELYHKDKPMLQEKYKELLKENKLINPRENILTFEGLADGILHFNTTRVVKHNPVDSFEISKAEIIARKQVWEMVDFLKKNSRAFENCTIISIAHHIGVRESRKLKGVHILTAEEIMNQTPFEDTIALGNYDLDIHSPEGTGTYICHFDERKYYQIPYRALLPKEYDNMLVAGRCLSANHEAHSAVRIIPICASMGEAAAVAISTALKTKTNVHTVDIKKVIERLKEKGAVVDISEEELCLTE